MDDWEIREKRCWDRKSKSCDRFWRRIFRSSVLGGDGKMVRVWDSVFVVKSLDGVTEREEG